MNNIKLLTFQQMAILKELRDHSSLRSLCVKLNINVSNISREMDQLENLLKAKIITTSSKGFILTPDGLRISHIADEILVRAEQLNQFSSNDKDQKTLHTIGGRGYLNLMATQKFSSSADILKSARLRFLDLAPNETIQLAVMGILDSIIHFENYDLPASWMTQVLRADIPWKLHVRKKHPLLTKDKIQISDVLKFPFVISTSWNGREISINEDGFPYTWAQRQKGLEAQTALMALQIVSNTDQIVFLPEIFSDLVSTEKVTTLEPVDFIPMTKNLFISVHTSRVSLKLFNLFIEKFHKGESNEKKSLSKSSNINYHQFN
jgi:DNA-binding transcriptional LysR family regulator